MQILPQQPCKQASRNAEPTNVTVINSGVTPKTLISPGALENPIVLKSSP